MIWQIQPEVRDNSAEYFEKTLIKDTGFREYDVRWVLHKDINPNGFVVLGRAFGTYVRRVLRDDKVVVGYDFRRYSQDLSRSLVVGLLSSGVNVVDIGLSLSPMLYFAQHMLKIPAGAMVTASHNENGWTGLKLADGLSSTLGPKEIQDFKAIVKEGRFTEGHGSYTSRDDIFGAYQEDLTQGVKLSRPIDVVLATGNGTAGHFAPAVLKAIGCNVVEVHSDLNWDFPHHNPNPEDVSFLKSIGRAVHDHKVNLGIGIDGDGDRIGVVDEQGHEVFSDKVGLLISRWIAQQRRGQTIVIDVKSTGLYFSDPVLRETDTKIEMVQTGHSYVKAAVAKYNAAAGFERSGHWFFNQPYGRGYDDALRGAIQLLRLLDESGASLSQLVRTLPQTWQSPTRGAECPDERKYAVVDTLLQQYLQDLKAGTVIGGYRIKELITVNGVRFVLEDDSWGLVRASSNKPSLVVVVEARTSREQMYEIMNNIESRLTATGEVGAFDQAMPPWQAS